MGSPRPMTEGRSFGKYTLVAKIATGGMAEILLARLKGAAGFEKLVCIKRILPHLAEDRQFVSMFLDEARIAALISHANVCQVFELGEQDGSFYIAMEYLEGVPLASFRRKDLYPSPPDPALVVGMGVQACEGLHHAHQLKSPDGGSLEVVHRDVSGHNLFVTTDGTVKVLDFGIAKVQDASMRTTTGAVKGTYAYMAPEQLRGERIDRRTDVFAMGIVMWETLAQAHLFRRDTDFLTFQAISTDPIPSVETVRPDVPPALAAVIAQALSRDPAGRFPSARALGEALAKAVLPLGGPAPASAISDEVGRAFHDKLVEQRALIKLARDGGAYDLLTPRGPALGHGTALTTPLSMDAVRPPTIRSETMSVAPLPSPTKRPPIARIALVAAAVIAAGIVAFALVRTFGHRDSTAPAAKAAQRDAAPVVAAAAPADAAIAAVVVPVDAALPAVAAPIDAAAPVSPRDAAIAPAPADAAIATGPHKPSPSPPHPATPAATGYFTVDSTPVYATIYIDGKSYGETPLIHIELPAGKHSVRAVSPSGTTRQLPIVVEAGKVAVRRVEW